MDAYNVYLKVLDDPANVSDIIQEHKKWEERRLMELSKSYTDMNRKFQDYKHKINKGI